jgi:hypothetical protein
MSFRNRKLIISSLRNSLYYQFRTIVILDRVAAVQAEKKEAKRQIRTEIGIQDQERTYSSIDVIPTRRPAYASHLAPSVFLQYQYPFFQLLRAFPFLDVDACPLRL